MRPAVLLDQSEALDLGFRAKEAGFWSELPRQLSVGGAHNMTVSWRRRLRGLSAQRGYFR